MILHPLLATGSLPFRNGQVWIPLMMMGTGFIYLGFPGGLLSRYLSENWGRMTARIGVVALFIASIFLPAVLGYLIDLRSWAVWEHPLNLFMNFEYLWDNDLEFGAGVILMLVLLAITVLINGPRTLAMVKEHKKALAHRRWVLQQQAARDAARQQPEAQ